MSRTWDNVTPGQAAGRGVLDRPYGATASPAAKLWSAFLGSGGRIEALERWGPLVARVLISQIFLISGVMKIVDWSGTEAEMAQRHMIAIPFFHIAATVVEIGAGLMLLLGFKTRLGALVLFLYLIPVTVTFHLFFWTYPPDKQKVQMLFLLHNLTLLGGLLLVMTCGPGAFSFDRRERRP
jgi:putative oxidoreductase